MVDLSITIVAYHNYDDIINAVNSIEKNTDNKIKKVIYIVDNSVCNTDNLIKKKDEFVTSISVYSDVEYIYCNDNLGFGKGHNFVLEQLDSKYHAIVNPDILVNEDVFSKIMDYMDSDASIGMVIPRLTDEEGNLLKVYRNEIAFRDLFIRMFLSCFFKKRQDYHTMQYEDFNKPFQVPFGQGSFLVVKTQLFKHIGGFDDRYFMYMEDADLCKRINQISKLMYYPDATVVHKWERGSHKSWKLMKIHIYSMIAYFKKWGFKW